MALTCVIFLALIAAWNTVGASPLWKEKKGIQWSSCRRNLTASVHECGELAVPIDYSDPSSSDTLHLSLVRIPAAKKSSRGSILFNTGGPGHTGIDFFNETDGQRSENLQIVTEGYFDLITFEPRGTSSTMTFSCERRLRERASTSGFNITGEFKEIFDDYKMISETCF